MHALEITVRSLVRLPSRCIHSSEKKIDGALERGFSHCGDTRQINVNVARYIHQSSGPLLVLVRSLGGIIEYFSELFDGG